VEAPVTIIVLAAAAAAEIVGDLGMRLGLAGRVWGYALGVVLLSAYGLLVNQPALAFGRVLGLYIAVFFVMSQIIAFTALGERPSASLLVGGALIVAGGLVIHFAGVRS
jgi:drug/metabolite transporter superfamily protein YnfA